MCRTRIDDDEYPETTVQFGVKLAISGCQYVDGVTERRIVFTPFVDGERPDFVPDDCSYFVDLSSTVELEADSARRLGQALIDAADEIDGLRFDGPPWSEEPVAEQ